jgi:hypothetical protein
MCALGRSAEEIAAQRALVEAALLPFMLAVQSHGPVLWLVQVGVGHLTTVPTLFGTALISCVRNFDRVQNGIASKEPSS